MGTNMADLTAAFRADHWCCTTHSSPCLALVLGQQTEGVLRSKVLPVHQQRRAIAVPQSAHDLVNQLIVFPPSHALPAQAKVQAIVAHVGRVAADVQRNGQDETRVDAPGGGVDDRLA